MKIVFLDDDGNEMKKLQAITCPIKAASAIIDYYMDSDNMLTSNGYNFRRTMLDELYMHVENFVDHSRELEEDNE